VQAEVLRLNLSAAGLRALDPHQRYVFALVGHIFNELMLLQKWLHVSRRPPGASGPLADTSVTISMFLLRVLAAKVYEAVLVLKKESVSDVLKAEFFSGHDGLPEKWDSTLKRYEELGWLATIRNQGAFHYMNATQWGPYLGNQYCEDAYMYVGERYADTLFHWAEIAASLPAMFAANALDPFEGLTQMLDDLGVLLSDLTDCLALGAQVFIDQKNLGQDELQPLRFEAPPFDPPGLHFFFANPRLK
jgi:hypothetical protein